MKKKNSKSEQNCYFLSLVPKEKWCEIPREVLIAQIIRYEKLVIRYSKVFSLCFMND